jgi:hypothetical protein
MYMGIDKNGNPKSIMNAVFFGEHPYYRSHRVDYLLNLREVK